MTREAARMRVLSDRRWAPARALRCSHRRGGGGLGGRLREIGGFEKRRRQRRGASEPVDRGRWRFVR